MLASYYGHADLVKLLLRHGADPNRLNDRGQSPLAGAVFKAEDEVVEASNYNSDRFRILAYSDIKIGIARRGCRS